MAPPIFDVYAMVVLPAWCRREPFAAYEHDRDALELCNCLQVSNNKRHAHQYHEQPDRWLEIVEGR